MTNILIKRGTSKAVAAYTGSAGELVMDTTNKTVHIMDGSTVGGTKLAKASDIPTKVSQLTNDTAVSYAAAQSLTTAQQKQALSNIGAVSFINTVITKRGGTAV